MANQAFAFSDARFGECQLVHDFLGASVRPRVEQALQTATSAEAVTWHGLLLRMIGWMRSLSKLNHPADFQPVVSGSRALFEIAVDVTLLHFDATNPVAKMVAWEDSARLKSATKSRDFFASTGKSPPAELAPRLSFISSSGARIETLRSTYWPGKHGKGIHPPRWTGRDLGRDAEAATRYSPRGEFDLFYVMTYPSDCWNTHGSGLAGVRFIQPDDFPAISALAFKACVRFALFAAEIICLHLGLWDATLAAEFKEHREHRLLTTTAILQRHGAL